MLEMKMALSARTYIVSGFPRNMRDVVEYSEKVGKHMYLGNSVFKRIIITFHYIQSKTKIWKFVSFKSLIYLCS